MRLRNKKTGEICELFGISSKGLRTFLRFNDSHGNFKFECETLAKLNKVWEDYEEPKEYWYLGNDGIVRHTGIPDMIDSDMRRIGNYFETEEEAERAVEKLKAWKRLKDKGLEIKGWKFTPDMKHIKGNFIKIEAEIPYIQENMKDLDLLFEE